MPQFNKDHLIHKSESRFAARMWMILRTRMQVKSAIWVLFRLSLRRAPGSLPGARSEYLQV